MRLAPGAQGSTQVHGGSTGLYVLSGRVNILIEDEDAAMPVWFELHPQDGFYIPQGSRYRALNMSGEMAEYQFGTAPLYRAGP